MEKIDPKRIDEIRNELVADYKEAVADFVLNHDEQLTQFASLIVDCHRVYQLFDKIEKPTERQNEVIGYAYIAIDNVYTSMKLLMIGYITALGNMLRQSLEATCMTVLLATNQEIEIANKRGRNKKIDFWKDYLRNRDYTKAFKAIYNVRENSEVLEVNASAAQTYIQKKNFYNIFSHPTRQSIGTRQDSSTMKWQMGGGYDVGKKPVYVRQADEIINYTGTLPSFLHVVVKRAEALPEK